MNKNIILILIIICYLFPIIFVYKNYNSNKSLSNIISNDNNKIFFLFFMFLMGIMVILYEFERNDLYSQILISILLIGLYSLIYINETYTIHYFFAFIVFLAILIFMFRHCYLTNYDVLLSLSLLLALILLLLTLIVENRFFIYQLMYILNFAFFYLYLHFTQ